MLMIAIVNNIRCYVHLNLHWSHNNVTRRDVELYKILLGRYIIFTGSCCFRLTVELDPLQVVISCQGPTSKTG